MKICDNTSAGVIIKNSRDELLLIERKSWPCGLAIPAGHLDGNYPEDGAKREIAEETGLTILNALLIFDNNVANPCRRENGDHHHWFVYEAKKWEGEPVIKDSEKEKIKRIIWASAGEVKRLSKRTEDFASKYKINLKDITSLTRALCEDEEWLKEPGLEPVWYYILKELKII